MTTLEQIRHIKLKLKRLQQICLLYTSDAADEEDSVDLGGRRIIKKKKKKKTKKNQPAKVYNTKRTQI